MMNEYSGRDKDGNWIDNHCYNCTWRSSVLDENLLKIPNIWECRLNPPQLVVTGYKNVGGAFSKDLKAVKVESQFPVVKEHDWCREFDMNESLREYCTYTPRD